MEMGGIFWDGEIPPTTGHNTPAVLHVTTRHKNYDKRICGAKMAPQCAVPLEVPFFEVPTG